MIALMFAPSASLFRCLSSPVDEGSNTVVLLVITSLTPCSPALRRCHGGHSGSRLRGCGPVWSDGDANSGTQTSWRVASTHSSGIIHD